MSYVTVSRSDGRFGLKLFGVKFKPGTRVRLPDGTFMTVTTDGRANVPARFGKDGRVRTDGRISLGYDVSKNSAKEYVVRFGKPRGSKLEISNLRTNQHKVTLQSRGINLPDEYEDFNWSPRA